MKRAERNELFLFGGSDEELITDSVVLHRAAVAELLRAGEPHDTRGDLIQGLRNALILCLPFWLLIFATLYFFF